MNVQRRSLRFSCVACALVTHPTLCTSQPSGARSRLSGVASPPVLAFSPPTFSSCISCSPATLCGSTLTRQQHSLTMAPPRSAAWLTAELTKALGWDSMVIEGVVAAIANAQTDEEVQELVANFMGDNQAAAGLIAQFRDAQRSRSSSYSASVSSAAAPAAAARQPPKPDRDPQAGWVVYRKGEQEPLADEYSPGSKAAGAAGAQQTSPQPKGSQPGTQEVASPEPAKGSAAKQHAEATLAMFRKGGRIKASHAGGAGSSKRGGGGAEGAQSAPTLERQVVNCLSCGKVYDCRSFTNDIIRFLERGGTCTFCGSRVALTYAERGQIPGHATDASPAPAATASAGEAPPKAAAAPRAVPAAPAVAAAAAEAEAVAAAVAFKDRLVDYDRNSAKRTSVIDDQSDYFEIDANAWLTDEERREMRERRRMEEEAVELQKSKRFTVTLDLIGRQVLLDNDRRRPSTDAAGSAQGGTPAAAAALAAGGDAGASKRGDEGAMSSSTAAGSQGGSQDISNAPSADAMAKALAAVRDMRIYINPSLTTAPPVFVPRRQQQQQQQQSAVSGSSSGAPAQQNATKPAPAMPKRTAPANSEGKAAEAGPSSRPQAQGKAAQAPKASSRKAKRHDGGRVQDDDIFQEFEASLMYEEFGGAPLAQRAAA